MKPEFNPVTARPPVEVPLPNAPLIRVVTRINFPAVVSIGKSEFIATFQEALRAEYPVLRLEPIIVFGMSSNVPGMPSPQSQTVWRFNDTANAWRVSLGQDFVALEARSYTSRMDYVERLTRVLNALTELIDPQLVDRIGVRYIDRIVGAPIKDMGRYVRPEVLGVLATAAAGEVLHSLSESVFTVSEHKAQLMARWGQIPPNGTVDPSAIEPIAEPSWILDLDMFSQEARPFTVTGVTDDVRAYSERIYTFFRWAVTSEFLKLFGGKP